MIDCFKLARGRAKGPEGNGGENLWAVYRDLRPRRLQGKPARIVMGIRRLVRMHGAEGVVVVRDLYDRALDWDRIA